jgi:hypothetical protein
MHDRTGARHRTITGPKFIVCGTWVVAALTAQPAVADDSDWRFQGVLYGYLASVDGETSVSDDSGGGDASVDVGSILEDLQAAFMGSLEIGRGRWGALADVAYVDFGATDARTHDFSIGGERIPADASARVGYDLSGWCWTVVGTYAVVERSRASLQALAGFRVLDITADLDWQLSGNVASIPIESRTGHGGTSTENWDAVIGVRGRVALDAGQAWFVPYYVDLGTGESDLTWQAMTGLGYTFGWGDVFGAWRHIDYDMASGSDLRSLRFSGPAVGVAFRW